MASNTEASETTQDSAPADGRNQVRPSLLGKLGKKQTSIAGHCVVDCARVCVCVSSPQTASALAVTFSAHTKPVLSQTAPWQPITKAEAPDNPSHGL